MFLGLFIEVLLSVRLHPDVRHHRHRPPDPQVLSGFLQVLRTNNEHNKFPHPFRPPMRFGCFCL